MSPANARTKIINSRDNPLSFGKGGRLVFSKSQYYSRIAHARCFLATQYPCY